jgi:hypothetical protein
MSVARVVPSGAVTVQPRPPFCNVATATESVYRASSGCWVRYWIAPSIAERIVSDGHPFLLLQEPQS